MFTVHIIRLQYSASGRWHKGNPAYGALQWIFTDMVVWNAEMQHSQVGLKYLNDGLTLLSLISFIYVTHAAQPWEELWFPNIFSQCWFHVERTKTHGVWLWVLVHAGIDLRLLDDMLLTTQHNGCFLGPDFTSMIKECWLLLFVLCWCLAFTKAECDCDSDSHMIHYHLKASHFSLFSESSL